MSATASNPEPMSILGEILDPLAAALTPESAAKLACLKASPQVQSRLDALAAKANEGQLSDAEREQYENLVRWGNLVTVLKAKAKATLAAKPS
jgi:hypothetical protein